jgi:hypothetical protein
MSSKGPYPKGLVTSLWHTWKVVEPLEGGGYWEEIRLLGRALEGNVGILVPFSLFASLQLYLPCHRCKTMGSK